MAQTQQRAQLPPLPQYQSKLGALLRALVLNKIAGAGKKGPNYQQSMKQSGQKVPEGAVSMPWEQNMQKLMDSYTGFFEKLENPQLESTFAQFIRSLKQKGSNTGGK